MTTDETPRRKRSVLLIISLCVNLFLIGVVVVGTLGALQRRFEARPGGSPLLPQNVMQHLPEAERGKVREVMAAHAARYAELNRDLRAAKRDVFRAFTAEPYDEAEFRRTMAAVVAAQQALGAELGEVIVEMTGRLTPEERARIAADARRRFWKGDDIDEVPAF